MEATALRREVVGLKEEVGEEEEQKEEESTQKKKMVLKVPMALTEW